MRRTTWLTAGLLTLGLVMTLLPGPALAATYYFSTSGDDDTGAGTQASPWRSLQKAAAYMSAGNTILLKRGDAWYNQGTSVWYIQDKAGTQKQHITLDAYGSGRKPVVAHLELITGGWTSEGSGRYCHRSQVNSSALRCFVNGTARVKVSTLGAVTDNTKFFADATSIHLYGNPGSHPVEVIACEDNVQITNCSYLDVRNIEFRGGSCAIEARAPTSHLSINKCDFRKLGCRGIMLLSLESDMDTHVSPVISNNYVNKDWNSVENDTNETHYGDGISLLTADRAQVTGNTVIDMGHSAIYLQPVYAGQFGVRNCLVEMNETGAPNTNHGYGVCIAGNEGMATNNTIRRNNLHDCHDGNQIAGDHNYVYSNIIHDSLPDGVLDWEAACLGLASWNQYGGCVNHDNVFANNTIYAGTDNLVYEGREDDLPDNPSTNVFKNNLLVKWDDYAVWQLTDTYLYPQEQTWQYNCFWQPGGSQSTGVLRRSDDASSPYTVAEADAALSGWANNLETDPLFVSASPWDPEDFALQSNSPVKAAGTAISGIPDFVDYYGHSWANPPSIGAIQYQAKAPAAAGRPRVPMPQDGRRCCSHDGDTEPNQARR
jgi:hypothetical protein